MAREGIMLASTMNYRRLERWKPPYIVQPKYNGNRCRAVWKETHGVELLSSENNLIVSVPHVNRKLTSLYANGVLPKWVELDGELYVHGMALQDIRSIVGRTINLHQNFEVIEYHIFDFVSDIPQWSRSENLESLIGNLHEILHRVPTQFLMKIEEVAPALDSFMQDGFEGIIIRNAYEPYTRKRCTTMMKYKPRKLDSYRIIGCKEEISINGVPKNALGAFICEKDNQIFKVGTGPLLTRELREHLWLTQEAWSSGNFYATIKYQDLTNRGVPFFPVIIGISEKEEKDADES